EVVGERQRHAGQVAFVGDRSATPAAPTEGLSRQVPVGGGFRAVQQRKTAVDLLREKRGVFIVAVVGERHEFAAMLPMYQIVGYRVARAREALVLVVKAIGQVVDALNLHDAAVLRL